VSDERWLVTGALGCIGAWTCTLLAREGVRVTGFDLGDDDARLRLIATDDERAQIDLVRGDLTDYDAVERAVADATHVVHLAALQVPFCRADPVLGARVNVTGTVNVFEAAKRAELKSAVAYASSAAVYDVRGEFNPATIYGVYKLANEGTARIYAQDHGVRSVGIRPFTVYGLGRDQGVTSAPTLAMAAAARGEPYTIPFGGRTQMHYAPDVARAFVVAARSASDGAATYNLGGDDVSLEDVAGAIGPTVAVEGEPLPFPDRLPAPYLDMQLTPLSEGVAETLAMFRARAAV
jgi:UDP-glucuronate 4-epimerase